MLARLRERQNVALAEIQAALEALNVRRLEEDAANGPRLCCTDWSFVTDCVDGIDYWKCSLCDRRWEAPCRPLPTERGE